MKFSNLRYPYTILIFSILGILIYSNAFTAPMTWDDEEFIINNSAIRHIQDIPKIWTDYPLSYQKRFICFLTFALNYHFHGLDPLGYHLVNILIHILNTLLVACLVQLLLLTPKLKNQFTNGQQTVFSFLVALLFLVHPLQTQAVTYITQRFTSLAALFYFLSLCLFLKGRLTHRHPNIRLIFLLGSFLAAGLGMLTKENVFTLPFMIVFIEFFLFQVPREEHSPVAEETAIKTPNVRLPFYLLFFLILLIIIPFLFAFNIKDIFTKHDNAGITSFHYFLTQFPVIVTYLRLLTFPVNQNLDYDFPLAYSPLDPWVWGNFLILLVILLGGVLSLRRYPLISFGIFWFFLTLGVESSIIPLPDFIFEHRVYLPSVGFLIALIGGLFYWKKDPKSLFLPICLAAAILSILTYQRNNTWKSPLHLWEDAVKKSPAKARPYANLARAYRQAGLYDQSIAMSLKALKLLPPKNYKIGAQIYVNLGTAYTYKNDLSKAIEAYKKAIELLPNNIQAYCNLGYLQAQQGHYDPALKYGLKAIEIDPNFADGLNNLGMTYGKMGNYPEAIKYFKRTLAVDPHHILAQKNLKLAEELSQKK